MTSKTRAQEIMDEFKRKRAKRRKRLRENKEGHDYTKLFDIWQARGKQAQYERQVAKRMQAEDKPNRKITEWMDKK